MSSRAYLPGRDPVSSFFDPKVPQSKAEKVQKRREMKKLRRSTKSSRVVARNESNHAFNNRLGRAWLTNECNRADRSGISIPVQRELMATFSAPEISMRKKLERRLSNNARVVFDRFIGQMIEAKVEQRRGRTGRAKLKKWWVDVQGGSGRKERRKKMREEGLLGAGYGEKGENEEEGMGLEEYRDKHEDEDRHDDEHEDSGEWHSDSDSDSDEEIGEEDRAMTPVPVSRAMTPVPVSRHVSPVPVERGERWGC